MAKNLKEAIQENTRAAQELDAALRDCISALRSPQDNVVEGRFKVVAIRQKIPSPN